MIPSVISPPPRAAEEAAIVALPIPGWEARTPARACADDVAAYGAFSSLKSLPESADPKKFPRMP
jgi:hypothetical protein